MQELEKILEEIEQRKASAEKLIVKPPHDKLDQVANDTAEAFIEAYKECQEIIRKHMSGKDTDVPTNDGWIPAKCPPKEGGKDTWYLIQVIGGKKPYMILNYHTEYEMFGEIERDMFIGDHIRGTAYKWRPLPDPYRPERREK